MHTISLRTYIVFVVSLITLSACNGERKSDTSQTQTATSESSDAVMMAAGLNLLNSGDAAGAEQTFRNVLKHNPTHYGAHFQLAKALDNGGKAAEARLMWNEVLKLAANSNDTATTRIAQTRLAQPDTVSQAAMMAVGLGLLYKQNNPAAAADEFRKVLERNPNHYGATYQLATALDRSGKEAEAR